MSYVHVKNPDELVSCPYDPTHRVTAIRFTNHLVKCQKNHPNVSIVTCPFNSQHRVKLEDKVNHVASCPDRVCVERDFYSKEGSGGLTAVPSYGNNVPCDEDWDTEFSGDNVNVPTYNPAISMQSSKFHNPASLSAMKPLEKRTFHKQLRTRGYDENDTSTNGACSEVSEEELVQVIPIITRNTTERVYPRTFTSMTADPPPLSKPKDQKPTSAESYRENARLQDELRRPFQGTSTAYTKGRGKRLDSSKFC